MPVGHVTPTHHFFTFGALVVLATVSLLIGIHVHVPYLAPAASLTIAAVKAVLVLWFFMHMAEESFRSRLAIGVALSLVLLLIALTTADVLTRQVNARAPRPAPEESFYLR